MRRSLTALAVALLAFPGSAGAAELQTWETQSRFVPGTLPVNVLLPDGYNGKRAFPVLYLLHGHGDAYDSWARPDRGDVARIAADLAAVVVMPEADNGWYVNWWNGGPQWERYHLDELIPLVERRLRIRPQRRWHAIAGLSMGGGGAMFYASQRPGYFGAAAAFSGVLSTQRLEWPAAFDTQGERHTDVYGSPQAQSFNWAGHNPTALAANLAHTRLYLAAGDGTPVGLGNLLGSISEAELRQHAEDFAAAAQAVDADLTYVRRRGIPDWPYWRDDLAALLRWGLFKDVGRSAPGWTYRTVAQSGSAWSLDFQFDAPPDELITFTREGNTLRASGSGQVHIATGDGCELSASLPFERTLPDTAWIRSSPRLRLRVRPRLVRFGRRSRLRFRVTTTRCGRREPVAGVVITIGKRRVKTGASGRAAMSLRLRRRRAVAASKPGYSSSVTTVTPRTYSRSR